MLCPLRQQVQVKEDDDNSSKTAVAASSTSQQEKASLSSKEEAGENKEETQVPSQSVKPVEEAGSKQEETKLLATTNAEHVRIQAPYALLVYKRAHHSSEALSARVTIPNHRSDFLAQRRTLSTWYRVMVLLYLSNRSQL